MKIVSNIRVKFLATLQWLGAAAHRRAASAIIAAVVLHFAGREIDSALIDNTIYVAVAALLAAWSHHTPEIEES